MPPAKSTEELVNELTQKYGDKFDYSKVISNGSNNKVILICNACNAEVNVTPNNLLKPSKNKNHYGCNTENCNYRTTTLGKTNLNVLNDLNNNLELVNKFDFSKVDYKRSETKIIIICKIHNYEFKQRLYDLKAGVLGCNLCVSNYKRERLLNEEETKDEEIKDDAEEIKDDAEETKEEAEEIKDEEIKNDAEKINDEEIKNGAEETLKYYPEIKCVNCNNKATFNILEDKVPKFCKKHIVGDMIKVTKICKTYMCITNATYGYIKNKPLSCVPHHRDNMTKVLISSRCKEPGCEVDGSFKKVDPNNKDKFLTGKYCYNHQGEHGISIDKRKCQVHNCESNLRPSYGYKDTTPIYCTKCYSNFTDEQKQNVIDLTHQTLMCKFENCNTRASFGNELNKPLWCETHNFEKLKNVINKQCEADNCETNPVYNYRGMKSGRFCRDHQLPNMEDILDNKCIIDDCYIRASFNIKGTKAKYCFQHKSDDMEPVRSVYCKLCLFELGYLKYDYNCSDCYYYLHPECLSSRYHNSKELRIMRDIYLHFKKSNIDIILDQRINGGQYNRRPDGLIKFDNYNIIIEIDERQHKDKSKYSCETKRLMELFYDLNNVPLIVIRFNPDSFKKENQKYDGLFSQIRANGEHIILDEIKYNSRINNLIETIHSKLNIIPEKEVEIIKLYYDTN